MEIFLFCLGVIGMTHIVVDGSIFVKIRDIIDKYLPEYLSKLIHCYQCTGFWCGLIAGYLTFSHISLGQLFIAGCAGSVLSNFLAIYMNYLEAQTFITVPKSKEEDGD